MWLVLGLGEGEADLGEPRETAVAGVRLGHGGIPR